MIVDAVDWPHAPRVPFNYVLYEYRMTTGQGVATFEAMLGDGWVEVAAAGGDTLWCRPRKRGRR